MLLVAIKHLNVQGLLRPVIVGVSLLTIVGCQVHWSPKVSAYSCLSVGLFD